MGRTVSLTKPAKKASARKPKKAALSDVQTAPKTRGEEIAEKVKRLHEINALVKPLEKEAEVIKAWFKTEAGGKDAVFEFMEQEVLVTNKERTSIDSAKIREELGAEVTRFEKVTPYAEVTCRQKTAA